MSKVKYYYNKESLRYEKIESSWTRRLFKIFGFLTAAMLFAMAIVFLTFQFIDSPKEMQLKREIAYMAMKFEQMDKEIELYSEVLGELSDRDDNIYRVIFEAEPIPRSVRRAGIGGAERFKEMENFSSGKLLTKVAQKVDKMGRELYIQSKSYDAVVELIKNKEELYAHIPAIQPVANKDLKRMASGYGYRIDPIYKTRKMHHGMDFSAPKRTEVYATGDGVIEKAKKERGGYGKHIVVDHGFNYKTLYAHLDDMSVKVGDTVKRGDIIGYVGSTGKSTAPHLHYEVIKNNRKVNPINYYFNDLSAEEYERMIEMSESANQSFD